VRAAAQHGGDDTVADHEGPHVGFPVRHELLQAVHVPAELESAQRAVGGVGVGHADHALALRAEERLEDDVAAELLEGGQRVVEALGHDVRGVGMPASASSVAV
jgi:hypothetical protein